MRCAAWLGLTTLLGWSCAATPPPDLACRDAPGIYEVSFVGAIVGRGQISVKPAQSGEHPTRLRVTSLSSAGGQADVALELTGSSACAGGLLKATLAASDSAHDGYKVLGGTLLSVIDRSRADVPFGRWSAQVVETKTGKASTLTGFWQDALAPASITLSPSP